ncbi:component of SufBCD complex [Pelagovum pacificum]|uniref:Component of SufBCD complex n=1 Tax=Pelagovum pacificum TaxID=2588711 RepID=A0A5C5GD24_9RHOB|nr:component of SufBCD complex [Pelagovum pacificum]QQA44841.1 component of SufBCD complex [Pelagovum pacificum]TNY32054.1 component of SufBCD complex [Pelagovum pacificum]
MSWTQTIFEVIDMRSFSNLWFWIALAVVWSTASHWVLGVPFDMLTRARKDGGEARQDLEDIVRVNVNRILHIAGVSGLILLGFVCFVLTALAILGFVYDVEFAQALFLIGFPMSLVGALSIRTATVIRRADPEGEELDKFLIRHRQYTQFIGMVSIFVTALWGMWQNLDRSYLFNAF